MSATSGLRFIGKLHERFVSNRRVAVLARMLAQYLRASQSVLDIGCGDGALGALLQSVIPELRICGVETQPRPECKISCRPYDGSKLPFPDASFDVCLMVDVLHHTPDVRVLLREARRASKSHILIKDHLDESRIDHLILKCMDWVGNRPHGVKLPYNYQSRNAWMQHFVEAGLAKLAWTEDLPLYPWPVSWVAGRRLHFITLLGKAG